MTRRVFIDMEATDLPWTGRCHPFWVGLATDDGSAWSALVADAPLDLASTFVKSEVLPLVPDGEPRLSGDELRRAILAFCGEVDEFWAWCPSIEDIADGFGMGAAAPALHAEHWDLDLRPLRRLMEPWPANWPHKLHDLGSLVRERSMVMPLNDGPHNPRHDAVWNCRAWQAATG